MGQQNSSILNKQDQMLSQSEPTSNPSCSFVKQNDSMLNERVSRSNKIRCILNKMDSSLEAILKKNNNFNNFTNFSGLRFRGGTSEKLNQRCTNLIQVSARMIQCHHRCSFNDCNNIRDSKVVNGHRILGSTMLH